VPDEAMKAARSEVETNFCIVGPDFGCAGRGDITPHLGKRFHPTVTIG
jgi:hypothetical protein